MNEEHHNRVAANATNLSQDNENESNPSDLVILSKLFKFSGFKYKMTRLNDLEGFHNQFHHINGIGIEPPPPGSANSDDYDLIGHLIRDFTATLTFPSAISNMPIPNFCDPSDGLKRLNVKG